MAVLSLPLSFNNSFWSQDYRKGLEVLFGKLEQGIAENEEIVAFITARAAAEAQLAASLLNPAQPELLDSGFNADDGASLLVTFRGLQSESAAQGRIHKIISQELETLVVAPFYDWAQEYKKRLIDRKRAFFEIFIPSYEQAQGEVSKLKQQYLLKVRRADEAEDDAKFAPNAQLSDKYTASPKLRPHDRAPPQRTASVSDRIAQRLREIQNQGMGDTAAPTQGTQENKPVEDEPVPKIDKGKGKAVDDKPPTPPPAASPVPISPTTLSPPSVPPMVVGGLVLPPSIVSGLLSRAASELPLRPIRVPVMGEYPDCFTGEEFVAWLRDNVEGFGGSLDRAEDAARDLTERDYLLRRIGEFGNRFELSDDAFYQFRPKAFDLVGKNETSTSSPKVTPAGNLLKRTGTLVNLVSKVINSPTEPVHVRAREEAKVADQAYRVAVRTLDRQRLALEDRIEETLKTLQIWEVDRLRAVKSVLLQYQGTLSNIPNYLEPSIERSATLIATYQPDVDLTALIERYRTGPFRPEAQVHESISHDEFDVMFGIDLRKWAEGGWSALMSDNTKKDSVPPVLTSLLAALETAYQKLPSDAEKRKSWIYEVPLPATHHLRESLNAVPTNQPIPAELVDKYDAPIIASTIKLWLLELNPPLALWEGWEEFRKLYPHVGFTAKSDDPNPEEQHMQDLKGALQRLPMVHLLVLDRLLQHLRSLIDTTDVEETNEVYLTKLALSLGRTIIRPKFESEISIQDRHPTLLFLDLLKHYAEVIPPTIARKKRDSERKIPVRKRTAPVDMRLHRKNISVDADPKQLLFAQHVAQNPTLAKRPMSPERLQPLAPPAIEEQLSHKTADAPLPLPPVIEAPVVPPPADPSHPVLKEPAPQKPDVPARPVFKEPPPEVEELPPRPTFKEPPPEDEDLPARPAFKSPPPEVEDTPRPAFKSPPPEVEDTPRPAFKSPPPEVEDTPRPPFKEPSPELEDLPPRPTFKEPPPEVDDVPPRPTFKEPPPEVDAEASPQPGTTKEEVPEAVQAQSKPAEKPGSPPAAVVSPKPQGNIQRLSGSFMRNGSPSPPKGSRPTSPGRETAGPSALSRAWGAATGTGSSLVRGPRMAGKGPRAPGESSVRGMVANLNKTGQSAGPGSPPLSSKRLSSPSPRSSLMFGRSGSLSRRTMASDAEDDVVERK